MRRRCTTLILYINTARRVDPYGSRNRSMRLTKRRSVALTFKNINDTLGHEAGDNLLKEVARRMRNCVREVDTVARLGGDEFTILLPEITDEADVRVVAEKVLSVMLEPVDLGSELRVISTSVGISLYPRDGHDAETLIKHADAAMYQVKSNGRAGMCFYSENFLNTPVRNEDV